MLLLYSVEFCQSLRLSFDNICHAIIELHNYPQFAVSFKNSIYSQLKRDITKTREFLQHTTTTTTTNSKGNTNTLFNNKEKGINTNMINILSSKREFNIESQCKIAISLGFFLEDEVHLRVTILQFRYLLLYTCYSFYLLVPWQIYP